MAQDCFGMASRCAHYRFNMAQDVFNTGSRCFQCGSRWLRDCSCIHNTYTYLYIATMAMVTTTAAHDNGGKRQQRRQTAAHDNNDHKRHFAAMYTINVKTRAAPLTTATKTLCFPIHYHGRFTPDVPVHYHGRFTASLSLPWK